MSNYTKIVSIDITTRDCIVDVDSDNRIMSGERIVKDLPLSLIQIVDSPIEELKVLMDTHGLTDDQIVRCKDIRRKERNKVSVYALRKRKLDEVVELKNELRRSEMIGEAARAALEGKQVLRRQLLEETAEEVRRELLFYELDPRTHTMEVRAGVWCFVEVWSQRVFSYDDLQE